MHAEPKVICNISVSFKNMDTSSISFGEHILTERVKSGNSGLAIFILLDRYAILIKNRIDLMQRMLHGTGFNCPVHTLELIASYGDLLYVLMLLAAPDAVLAVKIDLCHQSIG